MNYFSIIWYFWMAKICKMKSELFWWNSDLFALLGVKEIIVAFKVIFLLLRDYREKNVK